MFAKASSVFKQIITNVRRLAVVPDQRPVAQTPSTTMIGDAPITISLAQLDEMRAELRASNERHSTLLKELAEARSADPTGRIDKLQELARNLLTIARYAFANLPPSENPKWPTVAVVGVINRLPHLPDFTLDDQVLISEMRLFVRDIEEHEIRRARKRDALIASAPTRRTLREDAAVDAAASIGPLVDD